MKTALYLIPALMIAVLFLIRARLLEKQVQIYILKPTATFIVILVALASFLEPVQNGMYTVGVLLGLFLSLGGDIALMFQENRAFLTGLALFLVAHIAYAIVFIWLGRFSAWDLLTTALLLIAGVSFYALIRPNLGAMKGPVIGYMSIISLMVSRAFSTVVSPVFSNEQGLLIAAGAVLFYLSDVSLAVNRFWKRWRYHPVSLALYYSGQLLIALAASYFK